MRKRIITMTSMKKNNKTPGLNPAPGSVSGSAPGSAGNPAPAASSNQDSNSETRINNYNIPAVNRKVVLGLSGGVDSTAAALILQERGYEVTGLYFDVFGGNEKSAAGREKAETAARQLGIKFIYRDVSDEFREKIIGNFCSEYSCGRTPNPCIICNPGIKFRVLLEAADSEGAQYIATGHYAGTFYDAETGRWFIRRAASEKKDQSYMLYRLGQEVISRLLLPLDDAEDKEKIREIARKNDMKNAEAKDSQEICFIDDGDNYKAFLKRRGYESPEGDFVDAAGNVLGRHKGILNYTIGQRKGLGIALGKPAFVTAIDGVKNQVVLGDNADLFKTEVCSSDNIMFGIRTGFQAASGCSVIPDELRSWLSEGISAKIRYAAKPAAASLSLLEDGRVLASFKDPQRAPTPGQSIVFYKNDFVIGGGFID